MYATKIEKKKKLQLNFASNANIDEFLTNFGVNRW